MGINIFNFEISDVERGVKKGADLHFEFRAEFEPIRSRFQIYFAMVRDVKRLKFTLARIASTVIVLFTCESRP